MEQPEQDTQRRQHVVIDKPMEFYFKYHLPEFTEVILTILCEIYQDSNMKSL